MSLWFFIALAGVAFIGLIAVLWSRSALVLIVLLLASEGLGFLDPMTIAVKGVFDIHAFLLSIFILAVLCSLPRVRDLAGARFPKFMIGFAVLWATGVISPVVLGYSSVFFSLKASKEFLTIFAYFSVFLFLRTDRDVERAWGFLTGLGLYYAGIELLAQIAGPTLTSHLTYLYRREEPIFWKVYLPFWPVILIAFFHSVFALGLGVQRTYARAALGCLGLLLTFFRSYVLGAIAVIPLMLAATRQGALNTISRSLAVGGVLAATTILLALVAGGSAAKVADAFFVSGIAEVSSQSGGALRGREVFAEPRRKLLQQSPYLGFGFIDKDSGYGQHVQRLVAGKTLGFLDKGDVDVALKFGYVGGAVLYATAVALIVALVGLARRQGGTALGVRALTIASLLCVFLIVQPVHAPLTYSFGLLPLGLALGLIEREWLLVSRRPVPL